MRLSAHQAAAEIRRGAATSEQLVAACLKQIEIREPELQAWTFLDPAYALAQARAADQRQAAGFALGPLHGVPVGLKDIIDTADMPTENGTVLHSGRCPGADAALVSALRQAGAIILGKTVTTELATYAPGKTRNPHNPAHTPGGSSSGSAAAVAAGMVPLAVGSQTNGSTIRPAAYCGVFGYKPSFGLIPRDGMLKQSPHLDQVGLFARCIEDLALLGEQLTGFSAGDPATRPRARPPLLRTALEQPAVAPRLALVRTPQWEHLAPDAVRGFARLLELLGTRCEEVDCPAEALDVQEVQRTLMEAEIAMSFAHEYATGRSHLSASLQGQIERGGKVSALDYQRALARMPLMNRSFDPIFESHDAILTPAVAGTAPAGLTSTGNPEFCTLWTFCGMPAVSLPLLTGDNGLPIGVQLVGRHGDDARLLRTANWLLAVLGATSIACS
jgi:Asp-tRNA(Asn)/Glu-tRNA(Gln) amidotransferase A subunit family amidase